MKHSLKPLIWFALLLFSASLFGQGNFFNSLHATRKGKNYWYGADTSVTKAPSPGFESLTNVPIDHPNVACTSCHPADGLDANGNPYPDPYSPNCVDCHATLSGFTVSEDDCYGCHGRQATETNKLGYSDVHRDASTPLQCWDCHQKEELHGDDGVSYNSLLEPGAIKTDCEDCHSIEGGTIPSDHAQYDPHGGALHCDACHAQTVITCYNCHFESQVEAHVKRAKQPLHDFVILINRDKDGKVGTGSFQSLSYQGDSWVAFAPYHAHTITNEGRTCTDCHLNFGGQVEAIQQYNNTGTIKFASWDDDQNTLSWVRGVIPMPADYQESFRMDFITYDGDPSDPPGPSPNWSSIGEDTWDGHQMFFATPLSTEQMEKLGFVVTGIEDEAAAVPDNFALKQNYPNPFNPATTIEFQLPAAGPVTLQVFSITGTLVKTLLLDQPFTAGTHTVNFTAEQLGSGVYIYRITSANHTAAKKMILMK